MASSLCRSFFWATVAIFAIALSSPASADVAQAEAPELFVAPDSVNEDISIPMDRDSSSMFVGRTVVQINPAAFNGGRGIINLGGASYVATRHSFEHQTDEYGNSSTTSRWKLEGAKSLSTLTVRNGWISGTLFDSAGNEYFLFPARFGQAQEMLEIDQVAAQKIYREANGGGDDAVIPPTLAATIAEPLAAVPNLDLAAAVPDVVLHKASYGMYYDTETRNYLGGDAAAEVVMENKAEMINTNFANGGYDEGRVYVKYIRRLPWEGTGDMLADIHRLATDPQIAEERDREGADIVSAWVGGAGGRGYLGGGREGGFHVVGVLSGVGNRTEEHESGHNFWAQHDWDNATVWPPSWPYPDGYGYCGEYADVMAYCNPRGPFYSSPGTYDGSPMGNVERSNNLRIIALKFPEIAAYYADVTTGDCIPSSTALCLLQTEGITPGSSRFRVEATWTDFQGISGEAHAVPFTTATGMFWFFDPENIELTVKVLDGRSLGGHFWVFGAGMTTVEVTVTVTDTVTGAVKTYHNPMGTKFVTIEDTSAFAP